MALFDASNVQLYAVQCPEFTICFKTIVRHIGTYQVAYSKSQSLHFLVARIEHIGGARHPKAVLRQGFVLMHGGNLVM